MTAWPRFALTRVSERWPALCYLCTNGSELDRATGIAPSLSQLVLSLIATAAVPEMIKAWYSAL